VSAGPKPRAFVLMLRLCTVYPQASDNRASTKRERRRRISAARHTAPAEGVPSLASALVKCCNGWNQLWQQWGLLKTGAAATLSNYLWSE
jgi:hypothetical protein